MLESIRNLKVGYAIQVVEEFLEDLSEEEQRAILFHEEAHCELGHVSAEINENRRRTRAGAVTAIVENLEYELAADAYAAACTSSGAMATGLNKLLSTCARIVAEQTGKDEQQLRAILSQDATVVARLKALQ